MSADSEPSAFFPPLSALLSGDARLISLRTAYDVLSTSTDFAADNGPLEIFCYDAQTYSLLSSCPDPLPKPSARSKSDFEAKTAPIQVNGSQNGEYDLEQMKQDALELSAQLGVEENFALRVVVLEWQTRDEEALLRGSVGEDRAVELSSSMLGKSLTGLNGNVNGLAKPVIDFADQSTRRRRQLDIHLQERSFRLRLGTDLVGNQATRENPDETVTWMNDIARQLLNDGLKLGSDQAAVEDSAAKCIQTFEEHLQVLNEHSRAPKFAQESEELLLMYLAATFNDMITIIRLLLLILHVQNGPPSASIVASWFRRLDAASYFTTLAPHPAWPDTTEMQCLVALVSFAILNAPGTLAHLQATRESQSMSGVSYPRLDTAKYIEDEGCVRELNLILYQAAINGVTILSPAIFAWAIISELIQEVARGHTEARDRLLEDGSSDNETDRRRRASRRDSRDDTSLFEKLYLSLQNAEMSIDDRQDPPEGFRKCGEGNGYIVVAQLSRTVSSMYACGLETSTQHVARVQAFELLQAAGTNRPVPKLEAIVELMHPSTPCRPVGRNQTDALLSARFLGDDALRREILDEALFLYPNVLSPLLLLLTGLTADTSAYRDVIQLLENLQSVTLRVPDRFNAYSLENEDEDNWNFQLQDTLPLFISRQALSWYGSNGISRKALTMGSGEDSERGINVRSIPAGTSGTVLEPERPMLMNFAHAHSGFEYLGQLLSTRLPNSEMVVALRHPSLELSVAAEIVLLISALLDVALKSPFGVDEAKSVLERLSSALPPETDVVNVIAELLESELVGHLDQTAEDGSLELLVACTELFALLVKVDAGKVWSALAHSSLLGLNGGSNALAAVVGGTETALGHFRFLSACVATFTNLVDDAIAGLVKRRPLEQPARRGRFDSPMERGEYTSERTMQRVLDAFTDVMLEAWESFGQWRFAVPAEKAGIVQRICGGFDSLLRATYGLQDDAAATLQTHQDKTKLKEQRLAGLLFPAADAVLSSFSPIPGTATSMRAFARAFSDAAAVLGGRPAVQDRTAQLQQARTTAELLTRVLRTLRQEGETGKRVSDVAIQLLKAMPDIAVIFTAEATLKGTIGALLAEITVSLQSSSSQNGPLSLLGHLSASSARAFLSILTQLDKPLRNPTTETRTWSCLSTFLQEKQQWLALYLLTGSVPKESLQHSSRPSSNGKSLLSFALNTLPKPEDVPAERRSALLSFVSAAQGCSMWANSQVRSQPNFIKASIDSLDAMKHEGKLGGTKEQLLRANELRTASLACEVLAQAVHSSVEAGDKSVLKILGSKLSFLSEYGMKVDTYNRSLHLNLADNFRARFQGLELETFRRSAANHAEDYGSEWTYDVHFMDQVLAHEKGWVGSMNPRGQMNGFKEDTIRANINLSLVSAQTSLLNSWSVLASMLAECMGIADEDTRTELGKSLAKTTEVCLGANAEANVDIPGTDKVLKTRAQMSFALFSRLSPKTSTTELRAVLPSAWRALQASPANFDNATQEEDLQFYRLGLQILFLAIQPHVHVRQRSLKKGSATDETPIAFIDPSVAGILAEIVGNTVAPAWRALVGNLHTDMARALPDDFALVTALLQAILAVPGVGAVHAQIAEVVASSLLVRSALSLYSWADRLAEAMDSDPVYGELAVQFLQVLSTVKPVAEHIALEGALSQLASANLSSYLRKPGGKGPFDEPRRMFTIWTEGILPLCLNLLDAVGPPVAAEVSAFLNSFPLQLQRANGALENREPTKFNPHAGAMTLGLVQEAHSLCLLSMILQSDQARAAAEGIDAMSVGGLQGYDHQKVIEEAVGLVRQKASLASRITPANGVEAEWAGRMVDEVDSVLSAKVIGEVKELAGLSGGEGEGE